MRTVYTIPYLNGKRFDIACFLRNGVGMERLASPVVTNVLPRRVAAAMKQFDVRVKTQSLQEN